MRRLAILDALWHRHRVPFLTVNSSFDDDLAHLLETVSVVVAPSYYYGAPAPAEARRHFPSRMSFAASRPTRTRASPDPTPAHAHG